MRSIRLSSSGARIKQWRGDVRQLAALLERKVRDRSALYMPLVVTTCSAEKDATPDLWQADAGDTALSPRHDSNHSPLTFPHVNKSYDT